MDAEEYDDTNRAFLQAFMVRGTMSMKEGKLVLAAIFTAAQGREQERAGTEISSEDVSDTQFASYIDAAKEALSPFDYEIRSMKHQVKNQSVWAIVNSTSDALTQIATVRTPDEMSFVKRILDGMFETYNTPNREVMAITSLQADKLRKPSRRRSGSEDGSEAADQAPGAALTGTQVEKTMKALKDEGWLERNRDGYYTLAPRALMELQTWLVETYNDQDADDDAWQPIKYCVACRNMVTIGQRCEDRACNARLHDVCEEAYWNSRPRKKCPKCEKVWQGDAFVGPKAITTRDEALREKRRSGVARSRQSRAVPEDQSSDNDDDGEGEADEVAEEEEDDD